MSNTMKNDAIENTSRTGMSRHPRPPHSALDCALLPADDPWWDTPEQRANRLERVAVLEAMRAPYRRLAWTGTGFQALGAAVLAARITAPHNAYQVMLVGALLWWTVALRRRDWPLAALQALFVFLNVVGIWKW